MRIYWQCLLAAALAVPFAGSLRAQMVTAEIDATRKAPPISKLVFGGALALGAAQLVTWLFV